MDKQSISLRIASLDVAALCDANKSLSVLDPTIRPVSSFRQMVGRAHIVQCQSDFLPVLQALFDAKPGDVLVIDAGASTKAIAGELFASEASRKGLAGIVIDGACRDTAKLAAMALPVYARFVSPMAGTTEQLSAVKTSITCGEVAIRKGDWLIGDREGIVVINDDELDDLITRAEAIQSTEEAVLQRIENGESLFDMLNFNEHVEAVRRGKPSQLRFRV
jgi:4-hydroxy-4-methyl-2-oxoglutarate aldolase